MKVSVYGASGCAGRLVTAEARRRGLDVVVSGRDASRLREVAEGAEVRVAGVDDAAALARAFDGCDVVVACAGPFSRIGDPVVRAAITAGAHYVDTYAERAEQAGVSVVPAVGFDILPGDMIAHLAGAEVEPLDELTIAYQTNDFDMTRGTIRSSLQVVLDGDLAYEDGQWRPAEGLAVKRTSFTFPRPERGAADGAVAGRGDRDRPPPRAGPPRRDHHRRGRVHSGDDLPHAASRRPAGRHHRPAARGPL
ncbi:NAD(P)H-binding protein [Nonomuraea bangladeshensis]|uniref:NAD(P)H-binding protein n=1 Tax=Nonomuraea bangladeshensis TaxID=404385 RepID=UPI003C2B6EB8